MDVTYDLWNHPSRNITRKPIAFSIDSCTGRCVSSIEIPALSNFLSAIQDFSMKRTNYAIRDKQAFFVNVNIFAIK